MENKEILYTQVYFGLRAEVLRIHNRVWGKPDNILKLCELYQCHMDVGNII